MIETKHKEHIHRHINDALTAIETLKGILSEAIEFEDFLTLSLLLDDNTLADIQNKASNALQNEISDCATPEQALCWWYWANIEFPQISMFRVMADETVQEIRDDTIQKIRNS